MKKRGKRILAAAISASLVIPALPVQAADPAQTDGAWTATPYTREDGTVVEGLEEAVQGKSHWLETADPLPAEASEKDGVLTVSNGIITREFNIPEIGGTDFYTQRYYNEYIEKELLEEEAVPDVYLGLYDETYDEVYDDTGCKTEVDSLTSMDVAIIPDGAIKIDPDYYFVGGTEKENTFVFDGYEIQEECEKPFEWAPSESYGDPAAEDWPPKGVHIEFCFSAPDTFPEVYQGIKIKVIYEMYDKLPAMKKRVEVTNTGAQQIMIGRMALEVLNGNEDMDELLTLETSYTCGDQSAIPVNVPLPCSCDEEKKDSPFAELAGMNHTCYDVGPAYDLVTDQTFASFDTYELIHSTYWFELQMRERMGMYRKLYPWITDNPLTFHNVEALTKEKIDHAAGAGFEMIIQSYGAPDSSAQMLSRDQAVLDRYKELIDYAHSKGVDIGIYQAQYTRGQYKGGAEYGTNGLGRWGTWCMASAAFDDYWDNFKYFVKYTGIDCVEIDGPYPGSFCDCGHQHVNADKETDPDPEGTDKETGDASKYAVHHGFFDSQVKQWENSVRMLCKEFRDMGVYIKVPAWYYVNGGNKCGIGYEEVAWSQPRQEQLLYGRQLIHNASYARSMSMSWSHVPFANYQGGGSAAAFQPFSDHMEDYNWVMAQYLGNGIASDFRGNALYDQGTQAICNKWVNFYNRYRGIVNSDIVHMTQAAYDEDGTDRSRGVKMDTLYHVNADNPGEKGLLWVYNQTEEERTETITVPMYYTGLTSLNYPPVPLKGSLGKDVHTYGIYPPNYDWLPTEESDYQMPEATGESTGTASFVREGVKVENVTIDSNGNAQIKVTLPPMSFTYYAIYDESEVPEVELKVGKVNDLAAGEITENSVELTWNKEVDIQLTEDGTVNDNPAVTVDSYNVYRDGEMIGTTMTNSYTDTEVQESTEYTYAVEAVVSDVRGELSDSLKAVTQADQTKPEITAANAVSAEEIRIQFSEKIDRETAEEISNYILSDEKKILSAELENDREVILKTDALEPLKIYRLQISNLSDTSAAGNVIDPQEREIIYGYIAKYDMDSVENNTLKDYFGIYDGTAYKMETVELSYGKGTAFSQEKSSYADLGSGLFNGLDQYSINMWIHPEVSGRQVLLSQGQEEMKENDFTLYLEDGILKFSISNPDGSGVTLESSEPVQSGEWNMATVVWNGRNISLALNGEIIDTEKWDEPVSGETQNALYLGAVRNHAGGDRTDFYTGVMDEVSLYAAALEEGQIKSLFDSYAVKLGALLDKAQSISAEYYTEASYAQMEEAASTLQKCMESGLSPDESLEAAEALEQALNDLEKKEEYADLAAVYRMDEEQGTTVADGISGNNGTLENGDYLRYGTPFGKGIYVTELAEDAVTIPKIPYKEQDAYSITGWFKSQLRLEADLQKAGRQVLFSDKGGHLVLGLEKNQLVLELNNGSETAEASASDEIAYDTVTGGEVRPAWNHFAIIKDGGAFKVYLNGSEVISMELPDTELSGTLCVGARQVEGGKANYFNGLVDEIHFYSAALEKSSVQDLYEALPLNKGSETNVALNQTLISDSMTDAYRLNDGKVFDFASADTPWTARNSGQVSDAGIKYGIDLGENYNIKALSLTQFFRQYGNSDIRRYRDVVIQISTSADFSSDVTTVFNTDQDNSLGYGAGTDQPYYVFDTGYDIILDTPVWGRYVRLINTGFYTMTLGYSPYSNVSELEVYVNEGVEIEKELDVSRDQLEIVASGDREFVQITLDKQSAASDAAVSSSDEGIASAVNQDGVIQITGKGSGEAVITVRHPADETLTKEIAVTVKGLEAAAVIDDSDEGIVYSGDIQVYDTNRGADPQGVYEYNKSIHYSRAAGDSAEYTFTGTGIDVITTVNVDQGTSQIYIDGELAAEVDTKTPNALYPKRANQMCVFSRTDLKFGEHTVRLVNVSGNMTIDAFRVYAEADKSALEELYHTYKDETAGGYIQDTWKTFQNAMENAETVLNDAEASQTEIDAAYEELKAAAEGLRVSKTTLEYFLDSAKKHVADGDTANCVQSVKDLFTEAIAEGEAVMTDENATKDEVKNASLKLMQAIHALNMKAADKTDLEMAVELAGMIDLADYVEAGQKEFTDALAAAEAVLADGDAMQGDVDTAWDALVTAMENLRLKADKSVLEGLLNEAAGLDLSQYTEESAAVFCTAFASAQAVFADPALSIDDQKTVDNAVKALKEARDGLTAKADDGQEPDDGQNPDDSQNPDSGNQSGDTGDDSDNGSSGSGENGGSTSENGNAGAAAGNADKESGNSGNGSSVNQAAKTGDTGSIMLIMGLIVLAALSGAVMLTGYKKKDTMR